MAPQTENYDDIFWLGRFCLPGERGRRENDRVYKNNSVKYDTVQCFAVLPAEGSVAGLLFARPRSL